MFSYGALLGYGDITTWDVNQAVIDHEYDLYLNGGQFTAYWTYNSTPGLQALPFSLVDQYSPFSASTNLKAFRLAEAFLSALVFGLLLVWMEGQFGLAAALATLAFMTASEWLTLFGMNIYWNLWAFYLPLIAFAFYFQNSFPTGKFRLGQIFWLMTGVILIKCLFNGFEFISAALVMPFSPLFYHALRDRWSLVDFACRFGTGVLGALTGALTALGILALQISSVLGGPTQAIEYIAFTFGKRTFGGSAQYNSLEAEGLRANVFSVLGTYLQGRALNLNSIFHLPIQGMEIPYWQIFVVFVFFTLVFFVRDRFAGGFPQRRKAAALVTVTWLSTLAPLSWFVLFKAHSYVHTQMNFILWQMPFTLFGFAMCAFIIANVFRRIPDDEKTA